MIYDSRLDGVYIYVWGPICTEKGERLDSSRHLILKSPHPSPLSAFRGFFGSRQFSKANSYLIEQGKSPIEWRL